MPELDKKIVAHKWATSLEPGNNLPLTHGLLSRYVVVQATDTNGHSVPIEYQVIADDRLQVSIDKKVDGPVTVVIVG
jgi:hypothetical protein